MPGSVFGKLQKPRSQRNRFGIGQGGQLGGRRTTLTLADKSGQSAGVVACFNFRQNALELSRLFLLHGVVHCFPFQLAVVRQNSAGRMFCWVTGASQRSPVSLRAMTMR